MKEAFEKIKERLEVEIESSDKYIREYDSSPVQIAWNKGMRKCLEIVSEVEAEYKDKFVFASVCEQIMWERDVAISQLKELGYGLGEKIRKVEAEYGNGKTNADNIRSMSDEESAELFARKSPCDYYCNYSKRACNGVSCKQGILEWLKSHTTD